MAGMQKARITPAYCDSCVIWPSGAGTLSGCCSGNLELREYLPDAALTHPQEARYTVITAQCCARRLRIISRKLFGGLTGISEILRYPPVAVREERFEQQNHGEDAGIARCLPQ